MKPTLSVVSAPAAKAPYGRAAAARPAVPADTISPRRDIGSPLRETRVDLAFMCFLPGAVPAMRPAHPKSLHASGANRKARRPRRTAGDLSSGEPGPRLIRAVHR